MKKKTPPKIDWRRLPRKPAASKRSVSIGVRLTPAEAERLIGAATAAGLSLTNYLATVSGRAAAGGKNP